MCAPAVWMRHARRARSIDDRTDKALADLLCGSAPLMTGELLLEHLDLAFPSFLHSSASVARATLLHHCTGGGFSGGTDRLYLSPEGMVSTRIGEQSPCRHAVLLVDAQGEGTDPATFLEVLESHDIQPGITVMTPIDTLTGQRALSLMWTTPPEFAAGHRNPRAYLRVGRLGILVGLTQTGLTRAYKGDLRAGKYVGTQALFAKSGDVSEDFSRTRQADVARCRDSWQSIGKLLLVVLAVHTEWPHDPEIADVCQRLVLTAMTDGGPRCSSPGFGLTAPRPPVWESQAETGTLSQAKAR